MPNKHCGIYIYQSLSKNAKRRYFQNILHFLLRLYKGNEVTSRFPKFPRRRTKFQCVTQENFLRFLSNPRKSLPSCGLKISRRNLTPSIGKGWMRTNPPPLIIIPGIISQMHVQHNNPRNLVAGYIHKTRQKLFKISGNIWFRCQILIRSLLLLLCRMKMFSMETYVLIIL